MTHPVIIKCDVFIRDGTIKDFYPDHNKKQYTIKVFVQLIVRENRLLPLNGFMVLILNSKSRISS